MAFVYVKHPPHITFCSDQEQLVLWCVRSVLSILLLSANRRHPVQGCKCWYAAVLGQGYAGLHSLCCMWWLAAAVACKKGPHGVGTQ
jgi:hypothetical protein